MSYDIELMHLKTRETALMKHPQYILGSNMPAEMLDGVEVPVNGYVLTHSSEYTSVAEEYTISEGDVSNYWIATAANAIRPLSDMLVMATDNLLESDVVWRIS